MDKDDAFVRVYGSHDEQYMGGEKDHGHSHSHGGD